MKMITTLLAILFMACGATASMESMEEAAEKAAVLEKQNGAVKEKVKSFTSPNGVTELCIALEKWPDVKYSVGDLATENLYCSVSLYSEFPVCPKTWSTSPGTVIYDLSKVADKYPTAQSYEDSKYCGGYWYKTKSGRWTVSPKDAGVKTLAKVKTTMNASGTSGTFSQASLLYYHLSRYFGTQVTVPVAVYREMDAKHHLERVSRLGLEKTHSSQNKAAWEHMVNAELNPSYYDPTWHLFTDSREVIYGSMLDSKGERYKTEFNTDRNGTWQKGQHLSFQNSPGFLALRKSGTLAEATQYGLDQAPKTGRVDRADLKGLQGLTGQVQVALWMRDLIEINVMDYIMSQQDRPGNIDYRWYWAYVDGDKVKYKREKDDKLESKLRSQSDQIPVPENLVDKTPVLVQLTFVNDNDAGGLRRYLNPPKTTDMLENLKHFSAKIYNRMMALDADLQDEGPIYQWLTNSIDLSSQEINQFVNNTHLVANVLRAQCNSLRFDLDDVDNYLARGERVEEVDCNQ